SLDRQFLKLGGVFLLRDFHRLPFQCESYFTSLLEDYFSGEAHTSTELILVSVWFITAPVAPNPHKQSPSAPTPSSLN
ncbi:MAG: hypothetical protein PHG47_11395, partial [Sulfuricella sp.]|nr:hypothetical protein [Sulfuricella sp.]